MVAVVDLRGLANWPSVSRTLLGQMGAMVKLDIVEFSTAIYTLKKDGIWEAMYGLG